MPKPMHVPIIGEVSGDGDVKRYPKGFGDRAVTVEVTLSAAEWAALVMLRDTLWPGRELHMVARKPIQDELIRCAALALPKGNRAKGARASESKRPRG